MNEHLRLEGITRIYPPVANHAAVHALGPIDLTLKQGEFFSVVGPSGCGKSTFARQHFKPTEVLSSDYCRGLVSDDENDQTSTKEAFEVLHFVTRKRLAAGRLTVIDATNVQPDSRKPLVALAREFHVLPIAIVFDFPEKARERGNPGRTLGKTHRSRVLHHVKCAKSSYALRKTSCVAVSVATTSQPI